MKPKRMISLLLCLSVALSLTACVEGPLAKSSANKATTTPETTTEVTTEATTEQTTAETLPIPCPEKPVLYLYPETQTTVSVKLDINGKITVSEPLYEDGWTVTADPDGRLTDTAGRTWDYLFWEGITNFVPQTEVGYCVAGEDAAEFLAQQLPLWGLQGKEIDEFIEYWLPVMEANPWQIVTFNDPGYLNAVTYTIAPMPDRLIQVFMMLIPVDEPINLTPPTLPTAEELSREGYVAVEWGGALYQ